MDDLLFVVIYILRSYICENELVWETTSTESILNEGLSKFDTIQFYKRFSIVS